MNVFQIILLEVEMFSMQIRTDFFYHCFNLNRCVFLLQTLYKTQVKELREEVDEKAKQLQEMSNEIRQLSEERLEALLVISDLFLLNMPMPQNVGTWLVCSSLDQEVQVRALTGKIA